MFEASSLYPVISSEFCAGRDPFDVFRAVCEGGAGIVQLREKNMAKTEFLELALKCRRFSGGKGVLLMIDDYPDIAVESEADGVHLGQDDIPVAEARRICPGLLIGRSTHNLSEMTAAQNNGDIDIFNIGPLFPTSTKNVSYPPVGIDGLRSLIPYAEMPFSVMGGIKERHLPMLRKMGIRHVAMVTEITQSKDIANTVRTLSKLLE